MTIAGWIVFVLVSVLVWGISFGTAYASFEGRKAYVMAAIVSGVLTALLLTFMLWWFNSTARGKRAFKTQESNLNNGIERTVKVYDAVGNLITEYNGKFDITYDNDRILFDDAEGKRHVIYYPTGTVVIDEK